MTEMFSEKVFSLILDFQIKPARVSRAPKGAASSRGARCFQVRKLRQSLKIYQLWNYPEFHSLDLLLCVYISENIFWEKFKTILKVLNEALVFHGKKARFCCHLYVHKKRCSCLRALITFERNRFEIATVSNAGILLIKDPNFELHFPP